MSNIPEMNGGRQKTIKKRKSQKFTFSRTHMFPNIPDIQRWNYKDFLKK